MSDTSKPVNNNTSSQPFSSHSGNTKTGQGNNKEVKYGVHKVKIAKTSALKNPETSASASVTQAVHSTRHDNSSDVYVATITTLALFANTLMEAGLFEEVTAVLTTLTNIIKDHEASEERKAENERVEAEENKRRDEQYLRQKQTIEALYERLLKQRAKLDLEDKETRFDDYLNRLETIWLKP